MAYLRRVSDGLSEEGSMSHALKWDKKIDELTIVGDRPTVGCLMRVGSLFARTYSKRDWWLTTEVIEILEETKDYVRFKTKNSEYEWRV